MADDLLAALAEPCGTCLGTIQVTWCHAWGEYLCADCRALRNDSEFRAFLADRSAAEAPGRYPPKVAADAAFLAAAEPS